MSESSLKAVIFDVDGTMAETEEAHRRAFNAAFAEFGFDWSWDPLFYKELLKVAGGKERIRLYLGRTHPEFLERPDIDGLVPALHKCKTGHYEHLLDSGQVTLRPGVERLMRELRAEGVALGIATTTHRANLMALLRNTIGPEGKDWFAAIGCGEHAPKKKPSPDVYLHVLEELGLSARSCLAVEDAEIGLKAALAAGIPTFITTSPYTDGGQFEGALAVLDGLGEPGSPAFAQRGDMAGQSYVTLDLLRKWRAAAG